MPLLHRSAPTIAAELAPRDRVRVARFRDRRVERRGRPVQGAPRTAPRCRRGSPRSSPGLHARAGDRQPGVRATQAMLDQRAQVRWRPARNSTWCTVRADGRTSECADTRLRDRRYKSVFMMQPTQHRFREHDEALVITMSRSLSLEYGSFRWRVRHAGSQSDVRTGPVVMARPALQDRSRCASEIGINQSRHSRRMVPIRRSHTAFAIGLRGDDFKSLSPKPSITPSTFLAKMLSRS